MRKNQIFFAILVLTFALGVGGTAAFAQVYGNTPYLSPANTNPPGTVTTPAYVSPYNADLQYRADKIIGSHVVDQQGERVGKIKDLLLDPNGRVAFAVVKPAWGMGFGFGRYVALPINTLAWNQSAQDFVLTIPRERLAQAPSFDKHNWPNMADTTWSSNVYRFYGINPYWRAE